MISFQGLLAHSDMIFATRLAKKTADENLPARCFLLQPAVKKTSLLNGKTLYSNSRAVEVHEVHISVSFILPESIKKQNQVSRSSEQPDYIVVCRDRHFKFLSGLGWDSICNRCFIEGEMPLMKLATV